MPRFLAGWLAPMLALAACAPPPGDCPEGTTLDDGGACRRDRDEAIEPPVEDCEPTAELRHFDWGTCAATHPGDLHLADDAAVAAFCEDWDCVDGGLQVGGTEGSSGAGGGDAVTDVGPLACLQAARFLMIAFNRALPAIELPALRQTGGGFTIAGNQGLTRVEAPLLSWIQGDLSVQNNPDLAQLELPGLAYVGEFFLVVDNPALPTSTAEGLRAGLCREGVGAATSIFGNGPG